mmetsp:Transcript_127440/g.354779  ORF Transcript_127440/g.354779 Transcript_127440/m.354779 type:complete len:200 (-) Transcript_127440:37-636(-)
MGIAIVTRHCCVAILLLLPLKALRTWRRLLRLGPARLRAAPLTAVQDLRVHEGLEVCERGAVVKANVPLWVHVPVPNSVNHVRVTPLAVLCIVAVLLLNGPDCTLYSSLAGPPCRPSAARGFGRHQGRQGSHGQEARHTRALRAPCPSGGADGRDQLLTLRVRERRINGVLQRAVTSGEEVHGPLHVPHAHSSSRSKGR